MGGCGAAGDTTRDGKLYAVGGFCNGEDVLSSVERYDPVANAWEAVAPMASARRWIAVAVLDGKLYAVGGYDGDCLSSVERYDPALDAWEEVAPMAEARNVLAVAVLDGKLYAVGGFSDGVGSLSSVERYDPALDAWGAVAPLAEARIAHAVAVLDGKLYAVGGEIDEEEEIFGVPVNTVERFDPFTNVWEEVAPMATARSAPRAASLL